VPTVQLVIVCATVLLSLGMLLASRLPLPQRQRRAPVVARRVTIHTRKPDDQAIHGLELHASAGRHELVDAHYVTARGDVPIPGTVIVPAANISWIQDHGSEALASSEPPAEPPVHLKVAAGDESE
jgi:hypothetical protein